MSFIWSDLLIFLALIPLLFVIYFRVMKRRREAAARFGSLGLLRDGRGSRPGRSQHLPVLILLSGIAVLILSAARPQTTVSLPRLEGTVILVFDVSGSMSATDMKPTRMEAAKAAASQFVGNQPAGVSIGVVAFSDGGLTVQSPTNDHNQTLDTIGRLVPRRGTSLANGILVGLNTIALDAGDPPILKTTGGNSATLEPIPAPQGWYPSAVIVLLSDGENNQDPDPMTAADLAADMGVRVYTVGLGSPGGSDITVEGGYTVHTQLNEPLLRSIAQDTGGNYYSASNGDELFKIYNDLKPKLTVKTEEMEVTSIFAGVGMLAFLIGGALSLLWFGRVP